MHVRSIPFRMTSRCVALGCCCLVACGPESSEAPVVSRSRVQTEGDFSPRPDPTVDLLEPRVPRAVAGDAQWKYAQRARADFNGDGREETAVLIADVALDARGIPMWEHGHRWQLYIEEADSTRTYVYARFLPNGKLEASVTVPDEEKLPTIVLWESTPHAVSLYEVRYLGPQRMRSVRHLYRELDRGKYFEGSPRP